MSKREDGRSNPLRRATGALAVAVAVHGALLAAFVTMTASRAASRSTSHVAAPTPDSVPIDVFDEPSPSPKGTPAPAPLDAIASAAVSSSAAGSVRGGAASAAHHDGPASARAPGPEAIEPPPTEATAPFAGVTMGGPGGVPSIGLGLGGPNTFAGDASADHDRSGAAHAEGTLLPPPSAAEAKRTAENMLREPARKREREVGLGPEGPVLKALGSATSVSSAPVQGRAVFLAIANALGVVIGIDVLECDGGRSGWTHAAELARTGLAGLTLRLPSSASSAEMRVEVTSAWKVPSGHDPGTDVSVFGVQTQKGQGKKSPKVAVMDVFPKIRVVELSRDLKVPVVIVDPDVISIKGDSANSAAKPRRIVQTRLLDSKVL